MSTYNKILIRTSLTDDGGTVPRTGDVSDSPDVIPYGTTPVDDPVSFFIENYSENVNTSLTATQKNYIYIRGKDLVTGIQKGDMYVYYAKNADLDSPKKWSSNMLKTGSGKTFLSVVGQSEGMILVGGEAFEWTPTEADADIPYSLIGVVVPSGTKPSFIGLLNFENYVRNNINVGWTKLTIKKPPPPPMPTLRWQTTFDYAQGDVEREMNFNVYCKNIPVGSYLDFSSDNNVGPNPAIFLDKTKVTDPNANFGIISTVPAGYKGKITFRLYYSNPPITAPLPAGSSVNFKALYYDTTGTGPAKPVVVASVTTTN